MRRFPLALAVVVLVALATSTAAYAAADSVQSTLQILKGGKVISSYNSAMTPCATSSSSSPCETDISAGNRDALRVKRTCNNLGFTFELSSTRSTSCSGAYTVVISATVYDCSAGPNSCVAATNPSGTWVTILIGP
jgi:opacity protein-like surface antigen